MRLRSTFILACPFVFVPLLLLASPAHPAVLRVRAGAYGTPDGSSWANAYTSIQYAVTVAQTGDQIWVAEGNYYERVTLRAGISLLGGFAGTETSPERAQPWAHPTVVNAAGKNGPVVTIPETATGTTVDGFTLTNGTGLVEVFGQEARGGGVHILGNNATITRNIIRANIVSALGEYSSIAAGGGIYAKYVAVTIANNIIQDNTARSEIRPPYPVFNVAAFAQGGGIALESVTVKLANNLISGNRSATINNPREAHTYGSALYGDYATGLISNNTIVANGLRPEVTGWEPSDSAYGSVHLEYADHRLTLANNIVAFNGGGLQWAGGAVFRHNDVYGNGTDFFGPDYTGEIGNISADPLFVDRGSENYHLLPGSPAADAGDDVAVYGTLDLAGWPRALGARVDMGAYERHPLRPPVRYVKAAPPGEYRNGTSWETAFPTIQEALNAVLPGEQVWVAEGTYTENLRLDTPDVGLYGGFAGTETAREERDPKAHATVLDGGSKGSVVTFGPAAMRTTLLDGFTIRGGSANHGGGILCLYGSRPTIRGNTITDNSALRGGGVMVETRSDPLIIANVLSRNGAAGGGGLEFWTSAGGTVASNLFVGNTANYGSHLFLSDGGTPHIVNNTFVGQSVDIWDGTTQVVNNIFSGCTLGLPNGIPPGARFGYNCFWGTGGVQSGEDGNIVADPLFVDPASGDYRLRTGSPAINAGDDAAVRGDCDLDGNPRIVGGRVDMGAYENQALPPFTLSDVAQALRIAAGLSAAREVTARYDVVAGDSAGRIDIADAVRLARKAAGLEANP